MYVDPDAEQTEIFDDDICDGDGENDSDDDDDGNSNVSRSDGCGEEEDTAFYGKKPALNMKLVDRSFANLGYIGYGDGIDLDTLDNTGSWQFQNTS